MGEVIQLRGTPVTAVLEDAIEMGLSNVLVCGTTKDGLFYAECGGDSTNEKLCWLLTLLRIRIDKAM